MSVMFQATYRPEGRSAWSRDRLLENDYRAPASEGFLYAANSGLDAISRVVNHFHGAFDKCVRFS